MKYRCTKTFLHDQLGRVEKGAEFTATDAQIAPVRRFVEPLQPEPPRAELKRRKSKD